MFLYKHKNNKCINKNILFLTAIFFSIALILFSGCLSFCDLGLSEDKECISYSEALNLCNDLSEPLKNYPICSDFSKTTTIEKLNVSSCNSKFENISNVPEYKNLSLNTEQFSNYFRDNLINSWKESDKLAYSFLKVNESCDSFLKNGFISSKDQVKTIAKDLDYYNNNTMYYFLGLIYSSKKDLKDINIELMQDTLLYKDYIELSNILNEFQKAMGKDFDVKDSLAKETLYFYEKYYSNSESRTLLIDAVSNLNNNEFVTPSDFIGWSVTILTGPLGMLTNSSITIANLISGIDKSTKQANEISYLLENASEITNLSEWNKLNVIRSMLNDFYYAHGPNSLSDKAIFNLLNNMDLHISEIIKDNELKTKSLTENINDLIIELDKKIQDKSKYSILYDKYKIIDSPYNLKDKLNILVSELNNSINLNIGEKHHNLIILKSKFDDLKTEINNYLNTDYKSLIALCTSDLINAKPLLNNLQDSESRILMENYLNLFFNSKDDPTKLIYCARFISMYSEDQNTSCLLQLKNLNNNLELNLNLNISEANCEQIIYSQLSDAKNSDKYFILRKMYSEYFENEPIIEKLKNTNCVSNSDLIKNIDYGKYYEITGKYTNDFILNGLLKYNYNDFIKQFQNDLDNQKIMKLNALKCYFENNYEIDYENNELIFDNIFGNFDIELNIELPNYGVSNIIPKDCLSNTKISKDNLNLELSCLSEQMIYKIISKNQEIKETIISFKANDIQGDLKYKICLPQINKTEYLFSLPIFEENILYQYVYDNYKLESKIQDNKLLVLFPNYTSQEKCINVNYIISKPFYSETNLNTIKNGSDSSEIYYNMILKNNLLIFLPETNYIFPDMGLDSDLYYNNKKQVTDNGLYYIVIQNFSPNETKQINYFVKSQDINSLFKYQVDNIYSNIQKLKGYSFVSESKINSLINELSKINLINNEQEKSKAITNLKKEVDNLLSDAGANYIYLSRYNLALQNTNNLIEQYTKAKTKLEKDYDIKISDLDLAIINEQKAQAEKLFLEGNIKDSVKILESLKFNSDIEKNLKYLYDNLQNEFKDLQKQAKKLIIIFDSKLFEDLGFKFTRELNTNQYYNCLESIDSLNNYKADFKEQINNEINKLKSKIFTTKTDYSIYKKKLDNLWQRYSIFEQDFLSDKYDLVKKFGITFSFTQSSLTILKNKLSNVTKDIVELDKLINNIDLNDFDLIYNFNLTKFYNFNNEIDSLNESIEGYQKELKSKANNELVIASKALGNNANQEFYKAKNAYDENNFVNSIYFSKVSLLGLASNDLNNNLGLYLGLGFIAFIVIVVILFGNKLKLNFNFNKKGKEKEVSKETYYSVEKED